MKELRDVIKKGGEWRREYPNGSYEQGCLSKFQIDNISEAVKNWIVSCRPEKHKVPYNIMHTRDDCFEVGFDMGIDKWVKNMKLEETK